MDKIHRCFVALPAFLVVAGFWLGMLGFQDGSKSVVPEAASLLGKPLYPIEFQSDELEKLRANLAQARADYEADHDDPERIIWLGRRLGYLWRYREAIAVFSDGIVEYPKYAKLYRHRGHRYITVREFDKAVADLEIAASLIPGLPDEIEPDGAPNKYNQPRNTSHFNIWYHLGLAYYLKGEFDKAMLAYLACMEFAKANDDMRVAGSHWLYMTYRRLDKTGEAERLIDSIKENMEILENDAYYQLLLMYKGLKNPEAILNDLTDELALATLGYGIGNWYLYHLQPEKAKEVFEKIVAAKHWAAFGYIAVEVELTRVRKNKQKE